MIEGPLSELVRELRKYTAETPDHVRHRIRTGELSRMLHGAITSEYEQRPGSTTWDPEFDQRVRYARQVIRRGATARPEADADLTALVDFLLETPAAAE